MVPVIYKVHKNGSAVLSIITILTNGVLALTISIVTKKSERESNFYPWSAGKSYFFFAKQTIRRDRTWVTILMIFQWISFH